MSDFGLPKDEEDLFRKEAENMWKAQSPYVVCIIGIIVSSQELKYGIVMEYMERGSLRKILKEGNNIDIECIRKWMENIACALDWIHHDSGKEKLVHGDVTTGNILVNKENIAKLTDFGISKVYKTLTSTQSKVATQSVKGTPYYVAPELLASADARRNQLTDIYSYGITVYLMCTKCDEGVFEECRFHDCPITEKAVNEISSCDEFTREIMHWIRKNCLCKEQKDRKRFKDILQFLKEQSKGTFERSEDVPDSAVVAPPHHNPKTPEDASKESLAFMKQSNIPVKFDSARPPQTEQLNSSDAQMKDEKSMVAEGLGKLSLISNERQPIVIQNFNVAGTISQNQQFSDAATSSSQGHNISDKILNLLGEKLTNGWRDFLRYSNIFTYGEVEIVIDEITYQNSTNLQGQARSAVRRWRQKGGHSLTFKSVISTLEKISYQGLADEIQEELKNENITADRKLF